MIFYPSMKLLQEVKEVAIFLKGAYNLVSDAEETKVFNYRIKNYTLTLYAKYAWYNPKNNKNGEKQYVC